ncbi:hypothetical protein NMY22_g4186 [Coprinellus aureogranulatus]|nr:hypothetical protein NMY22_g4186 [Coprinellus aureogranulatus]
MKIYEVPSLFPSELITISSFMEAMSAFQPQSAQPLTTLQSEEEVDVADDSKPGDMLPGEVSKPYKKRISLKEMKEALVDVMGWGNGGETLHERSLHVGLDKLLLYFKERDQPASSPRRGMVNAANRGSLCASPSDFNSAIAMTVGDLSESSFKRMAPKQFMAVELLKLLDGPTTHVFIHDLESVIWALVWLCRQDPRWYEESHQNVHSHKAGYTWATAWEMPEGIEKQYEVIWPLVANVVCDWMGTYLRAAVRGRLDTLSDDKILAAIEEEFPCPEEYKDWDWARFIVQ